MGTSLNATDFFATLIVYLAALSALTSLIYTQGPLTHNPHPVSPKEDSCFKLPNPNTLAGGAGGVMCDINVESWLDSLWAEHTKSSLRWNDLVEIKIVKAPKRPSQVQLNFVIVTDVLTVPSCTNSSIFFFL